jgi:hypothetical protein
MMRRKIALVCLAAVILCGTGIVLAKAVKVQLLPFPADDPAEPDASGRAVLNYAKGADKTEIQVNCWGLTPNSDYTLWISADGNTFVQVGAFTADEYGDGCVHARVQGDVSGYTVAVNAAGGGTVLLGP